MVVDEVTTNHVFSRWWKWGLSAWLLAAFLFTTLPLLGDENWFEGEYEAASWLVAGSVLAFIAVQSSRFVIVPWLLGITRPRSSEQIVSSSLIGVVLFTYFLLGFLNAIRRYSEFGSPLASKSAAGIVYGQIMLPNGYEFGLPDVIIAICMAAVVDFLYFSPFRAARSSPAGILLKGLLLNALLYVGTVLIVLVMFGL